MFIICKNRNFSFAKCNPFKDVLWNSTYFMFNISCEMTIKKIIHWGGRGNGGTVLISSLKCNDSIYLDIQVYYMDNQAISTLLCLLLVLDL